MVAYNPNSVIREHYLNPVFSPTSATGTIRYTATSNPGYSMPWITLYLQVIPFMAINRNMAIWVGMIPETPVITNQGLNS
jgi:hypothetical protein